MRTLRLRSCLALVAIFISGMVCAQQPAEPRTVAKLKDIEGTVLVSQGDAMAAGAKDQRLRPDARVVTTAGSKVTINYDKGCDVRLEENQRFVVRELGECAALIASVTGTGVGAAAVGGGISGMAVLGAVGVGAAITYAVDRDRSRSVSPN